MARAEKKSLHINALLNVIKQCCAIIFPMITFPYVSRTLGIEMYGKYNFAAAMVSYVALLAGLGISSYAVREGSKIRDDKVLLGKFVNEVFSINVFSTIISYICMGILIVFWEKMEEYKLLIVIISISVFLNTIGTDWINIIFEDFLYITIRYIVSQIVAIICILFFVKKQDDLMLYAFFSNLGILLANFSNIFYIRKKLKIKIRFIWKVNLKCHLKPILILFGNVVSVTIYLYSDNIMLGIMSGNIAVGYYAVSSKIYLLVKQMLNAIANSSIPKISYDLDNTNNDINKTVNKMLGALIILVLPCIMGLICLGKEIIILLSGNEYVNAYSSLVILSFALLFSTIACIFVNVVMLINKMDKQILIASIESAVTNVCLNFILIPYFSYNAAAVTTLVSEMIMMCMGLYFSRKKIHINILKEFLIGTIGMIFVFVVCVIFKKIFINTLMRLFISICVSVLGYGLILTLYYFRYINKKYKIILK